MSVSRCATAFAPRCPLADEDTEEGREVRTPRRLSRVPSPWLEAAGL